MDLSCWKKVLFEWISKCNFIQESFTNIEEAHIEDFFGVYVHHMHIKDIQQNCTNLLTFLKSIYASFMPNLNDKGELRSSDHIYVYSLLLHYSCVQNPEEYFHEICKKLPDISQECIAAFFNQMLECQTITRDVLRQSFMNIVGVYTQSSKRNEQLQLNPSDSEIDHIGIQRHTNIRCDHKSSSDVHVKSPLLVTSSISPMANIDANVRTDAVTTTPIRSLGGTVRISPSTPKTIMLESRTRELFNLRAQLDTERYEKALLEVQIKQSDEHNAKLGASYKKLQLEMKEINNNMIAQSYMNEERESPRTETDQLKKRLQKEIGQKEKELSELSDTLRDVNEVKTVLEKKLEYAEKKIIVCIRRITELESKIDELTAELEKKATVIKYLNSDKAELEHYISETRLMLQKRRTDLNTSSDFVDSSFTQSSSISNSPENLGCSVVDLQLREQEHENTKLREELQNVLLGKKQMVQKMHALIEQSALRYHLEIECGNGKQVSADDADVQFELVTRFLEQLSMNYDKEQLSVKQLQEETNLLTQNKNELLKRVFVHEVEMEMFQNELQQAAIDKIDIQISNEKMSLKQMVNHFKRILNQMNLEKNELMQKVQQLDAEMVQFKDRACMEKNVCVENMQRLEAELKDRTDELDRIKADNMSFQTQLSALQMNIVDLQTKLETSAVTHTAELEILNQQLEETRRNLELRNSICHVENSIVNDKYEKMVSKYENVKCASHDAEKHLVDMRNELIEKEYQLVQLGTEITDVRSTNNDFEANINLLMSENSVALQQMEAQLSEKIQHIAKLEEVRDESLNCNYHLRAKYQQCRGQLIECNRQFDALRNVLKTTNWDESIKCTDALISYKKEAKAQIELLNSLHHAKETEIKGLQVRLHASYDENKKLERQICDDKENMAALQERVNEAEKKLEISKKRSNDFVEQIKTDLTAKEIELRKQFELSQAENIKYELTLQKERAEMEKLHDEVQSIIMAHEYKQAETKKLKQKLIDQETKLKDVCNAQRAQVEEFYQVINSIVLADGEQQVDNKDYCGASTPPACGVDTANTSVQDSMNAKRLLDAQNLIIQFMQQKEQFIEQLKEKCCKQAIVQRKNEVRYDSHAEISNVRIATLKEELERVNKQYASMVADESSKALNSEMELMNEKLGVLMESHSHSINELDANDKIIIDMVSALVMHASSTIVDKGNNHREVEKFFTVSDEASSSYAQLQRVLNEILHSKKELALLLSNSELRYNDALTQIDKISETNRQLKAQHAREWNNLSELKDQLESDMRVNSNKLNNQIKHLNETINNLEHVNETLSSQNVKLQTTLSDLESCVEKNNEKLKCLTKELANVTAQKIEYAEQITTFNHNEQNFIKRESESLKQLRNVEEELSECRKYLQDVSNKLSEAEITSNEYRNSYQKTCEDLNRLQEEVKSQKADLLHSSHEIQQQAVTIENEHKANAELIATNQVLREQIETLESSHTLVTKELRAFETEKTVTDKKEKRLLRELEELQAEHDQIHKEVAQLNIANREFCKAEETLHDQLLEAQCNYQAMLDKFTETLRKFERLYTEKDSTCDENKLFCPQKLKSELNEVDKQSQTLECNGLGGDDELENILARFHALHYVVSRNYEDLERLQEEQKRTCRELEVTNKKLSDAQALVDKLKHERTQQTKTMDQQTMNLIKLQLEVEHLNAQVAHVSYQLEAENTRKNELEYEKQLATERFAKMSNKRDSLEGKIRTMGLSINTTEIQNVKLTHEIGALNSQIQQQIQHLNEQSGAIAEANVQYEGMQVQLEQLQQQLQKAEEDAHVLAEENKSKDELSQQVTKLHADCAALEAANASLRDKLEQQVKKSADIVREYDTRYEKFEHQLMLKQFFNEKVDHELTDARAHIEELEQELALKKISIETFQANIEQHNQELCEVRNKHAHILSDYDQRITAMQQEVFAANAELNECRRECTERREAQPNSKTGKDAPDGELTFMPDLQAVREHENILEIKTMLRQERETNAQLRLNNQVLQAKYSAAKERIAEEVKQSEERIKEQRLELEGKLEKMKSKMKVLYTEEISKMKAKQEREVADSRNELEQLQVKNKKYEEHTRKLSNQIVRLNDKVLEHQKQTTVLSTKLKHLEESQEAAMQQQQQQQHFKRPSSIHISTTAAPTHVAVNLGTNLAMEDEEGEIFNNTYLTDLKSGRMSEMTAEELQYRNSLLPPHLKSAYAAQYDLCGAHEDDIKDGQHSLDDSMSALLSTTNGGGGSSGAIRKKLCGTHYKRPGPPTPSKHGGRLSFGGVTEPARDVLKETYDGGNAGAASSSSAKTPARFSFFSSRFSLGGGNAAAVGGVGSGTGSGSASGSSCGVDINAATASVQHAIRDEQRMHQNLLRRVQKRNIPSIVPSCRVVASIAAPFCTSTPRKSRTYYDQRRLINYCAEPMPSAKVSANAAAAEAETAGQTESACRTVATDNDNGALQQVTPQTTGGRQHSRRRCAAGSSASSSKKGTPQVRRVMRRASSTATSTSSGGGKYLSGHGRDSIASDATQRQPQRRQHKRRSLIYLNGSTYARPNYRTSMSRQVRLLQYLKKSRQQRFECFDRGRRHLQQEESGGAALSINATYDVKNNIYSYNDNNTPSRSEHFGATMVLDQLPRAAANDDVDTIADYIDIIQYSGDVEEKHANAALLSPGAATFAVSQPRNAGLPPRDNHVALSALNTPQNVKHFEQLVQSANNSWIQNAYLGVDIGSDCDFQRVCREKTPHAPFELRPLNYSNADEDYDDGEVVEQPQELHMQWSELTTMSHLNSSAAGGHAMDVANGTSVSTLRTANSVISNCNCCSSLGSTCCKTKNNTTASGASSTMSRTIYPHRNVFSQRLPNVDHIRVRKSLIFIKQKFNDTVPRAKLTEPRLYVDGTANSSSAISAYIQNLSNETITPLDLFHMWRQMNSSARFIVCLAALAIATLCCNIFGYYSYHVQGSSQ